MSEHIDTHRPFSEPRLPLAGAYPCLTFQLNATYHTMSDSVKWVLAIREPNDKVELTRYHGSLQDFEKGIAEMRTDIELAIGALGALRRSELWRDS